MYLLALSIGPVQSLIEAGRRARDLWCGSWLLSEAAKAAALYLHQRQAGCLIFPCVEKGDTTLLAPSTHAAAESANIANVLRAAVALDSEQALREWVAGAKQAAVERVRELSEQARADLQALSLNWDIWRRQQGDILETYAAWVQVAEADDYPAKAARLSTLLQSRKLSRDFAPLNNPLPGLAKSSLDGAQESVIATPHRHREDESFRATQRKLALSRDEDLDTLGVIKRVAGAAEQFTPFSRIAADAWLMTQAKAMPEKFADLKQCFDGLLQTGRVSRVQGNNGLYADFPYDADLLFGSRLAAAKYDEPEEDFQALEQTISAFDSQPLPYGVLLKADGDHMGNLLSLAQTPQASREISHALHGFASEVRPLLKQFRGHAIYAGGDDVLAFVPLQEALACAAALAKCFADTLQPIADKYAAALSVNEQHTFNAPTLSVGLAVGHVIQPMRQLRQRALRAEKLAKEAGPLFYKHVEQRAERAAPRNALGICLGLRSGPELQWRCRWSDGAALSAMWQFCEAFRAQRCPSRLAYDLRQLARQGIACGQAGLSGQQCAELLRVLDRARLPGNSQQTLDTQLKKTLVNQAQHQGLSALAEQLMIARWLSAVSAAEVGIHE